MQKNKKLALKLGIQTYHILTNDDEVCIASFSSILLAVLEMSKAYRFILVKVKEFSHQCNLVLGKRS